MEPNMRDEPRPSNDSRSRATSEPKKVEVVERKPSLGDKWRDLQPSKTTLVWACLASIVLTIVIGFTLGGWMTAGGAQEAAKVMANEAVVQRLAPICVAQFNADPDSVGKLGEMNGMTSYGRVQYVQDQGWATITGAEKPDRKVADACIAILMDMSQE